MEQVIAYIEKNQMIRAGDCVIAGVSGGADSLCLLFVLLELRRRLDFRIEVVHIEHGIRGSDSLDDAEFVRQLCEELDVSFHLCSYTIPERAAIWRISVEEAARKCRYEAFEEVSLRCGGTKIAVAHHKDDQAETILWNLVRGSGLRGLCGMRPVNGVIIRPLLDVTRSEIEAYLREKGIAWRTDSTNLETEYTRNKLRHQIIPLLKQELNSQAAAHIAAAGAKLYQAESYLQVVAAAKAAELGERKAEAVWIQRRELLREEVIIQEYILRFWMEQLGVGLKDIGAVHVEQMLKLAAGRSGRAIALPGDRSCRCTGAFLVLGKVDETLPDAECTELIIPGEMRFGKWRIITEILPCENQIIPEKKYTKWLDYDTIVDTVRLRTRQLGDYFYLPGGRKKLKNYFIDEKVLKEERGSILLLADGSHILWAVGYRISDRCKVTKDTKRVLKIQMEE